MNLVSRLLPANHVLLDLDASSKKRLFEQIALLFENSLRDRAARLTASSCEKLWSGWARRGDSHGRIKAPGAGVRLRATRRHRPTPDGQPVNLVFAMLVPEHATEAHLELLSELAQMFSDSHLREELASTDDIQAAHRLITEWSPYAPAQRTAAV